MNAARSPLRPVGRGLHAGRDVLGQALQRPHDAHPPVVLRGSQLLDHIGDHLEQGFQFVGGAVEILVRQQVHRHHLDALGLAPADQFGDLERADPMPVRDIGEAVLPRPPAIPVADDRDVTRMPFACQLFRQLRLVDAIRQAAYLPAEHPTSKLHGCQPYPPLARCSSHGSAHHESVPRLRSTISLRPATRGAYCRYSGRQPNLRNRRLLRR